MGPNLYETFPGATTTFHIDAAALLDSIHFCYQGHNEIFKLRQMESPEELAIAFAILFALDPRTIWSTDEILKQIAFKRPHARDWVSITQLCCNNIGPLFSISYFPLLLCTILQDVPWPTDETIQKLKFMNFYPMIFCASPGALAFLSRLEIHAFRKAENLQLPASDCHFEDRNLAMKRRLLDDMQTCISFPFDSTIISQSHQDSLRRTLDLIFKALSWRKTYDIQEYPLGSIKAIFYQFIRVYSDILNNPDTEEGEKNKWKKTLKNVLGISHHEALPVLFPFMDKLIQDDKKGQNLINVQDYHQGNTFHINRPEDEEFTGIYCWACRDEAFNGYIGCLGCHCNKAIEYRASFCFECGSKKPKEPKKTEDEESNALNCHYIPKESYDPKGCFIKSKAENLKSRDDCDLCIISRKSVASFSNGSLCNNCGKCPNHLCICHSEFFLRARWEDPGKLNEKFQKLKEHNLDKEPEGDEDSFHNRLAVQMGDYTCDPALKALFLSPANAQYENEGGKEAKSPTKKMPCIEPSRTCGWPGCGGGKCSKGGRVEIKPCEQKMTSREKELLRIIVHDIGAFKLTNKQKTKFKKFWANDKNKGDETIVNSMKKQFVRNKEEFITYIQNKCVKRKEGGLEKDVQVDKKVLELLRRVIQGGEG